MYLTKEEFLVLSARKLGIHSREEISQKFKLSQTSIALCDNALYQKYGIKANSTVELKQKLVEIADLKKVEIVDSDKIPYFEYENDVLVKKIKITKIDVLALLDYFQYIEDEKKEYELILNEDASNMYRILEIKDVETLEKTKLTSEAG